MKLYFSKGACSLAARIIINELNLTCEYEAVDLKHKKTASGADYLRINSKGSVPALKLQNGEILTENAVIQQYLADTHQAEQLLPPIGNFNRYRVLEWLNYISTDLHKVFGVIFNPFIPQHLKDEVFKPSIIKQLHWVDRELAKHSFLVDNFFTLADAYLFVIITWMPHVGLKLDDFSNLKKYFSELNKRKSIEKSLSEEENA